MSPVSRPSISLLFVAAASIAGGAAAGLAQARPEPGTTFRDCDVCPEMIVVPAGAFVMGSPPDEPGRYDDEGPAREVTIAEPFAIGVREVTFEEWDACVAAGGCDGYEAGDEGRGRGGRPVLNANWDNARAYVFWLAAVTGEAYRLPSEAEWEYAARAGASTRYGWGDEPSARHANGGRGQGWPDDGHPYTAPTGSFAANSFGCTTRMATSGSGPPTAGTTATRAHRTTAAPGSPATARAALCAAAPTTAAPATCARPCGSGSTRASAATSSASGWRGRWRPESAAVLACWNSVGRYGVLPVRPSNADRHPLQERA